MATSVASWPSATQWDTRLRLVVSRQQKPGTAFTLLRRLNAYSQQHAEYLADPWGRSPMAAPAIKQRLGKE